MKGLFECNGRMTDALKLGLCTLQCDLPYLINTKSSETARKNTMPRNTMPKNPFQPIRATDKPMSSNPRTVANRRNLHTKSGLALSDHRDDVAFRTNKTRALRKLHKSKKWKDLTSQEQLAEEQKVVSRLEKEREEKKVQHMVEWEAFETAQKETAIEQCPDAAAEECHKSVAENTDVNEVDDNDGSDSWISISSNNSEVRKMEFEEILKHARNDWNEKLNKWKAKLNVGDEKWRELESGSTKKG